MNDGSGRLLLEEFVRFFGWLVSYTYIVLLGFTTVVLIVEFGWFCPANYILGLPDRWFGFAGQDGVVVDFETVSLTLSFFSVINVLRWERCCKQQSDLCKFYR